MTTIDRGPDLREAAQRKITEWRSLARQILDTVDRGDVDDMKGRQLEACALDLEAAVQDARERGPQRPSPEAIEAALECLKLPPGSYWISAGDRIRPTRSSMEQAIGAAYAVDGVGAYELAAQEIERASREGKLSEGLLADSAPRDAARNVCIMLAHRLRRLGSAHAAAPARDACQLCRGSRGGVSGNENIVQLAGIDVTVCDYCDAALRPQ